MSLGLVGNTLRWAGGLLAFTALAAEFGEQWQAHCRRVPAFLPWLFKPK